MFQRKSTKSSRQVFGVLNGPNLNRLGIGRSTDHYGTTTLDDLDRELKELADSHDADVLCYQSHEEGKLIEYIHCHDDKVSGWIINPGALMIHGYSLADAIEDSGKVFIEVHLSKIYQREKKRHLSVLSPYCYGQITGLGTLGYKLALLGLVEISRAN